MNERQFYIYVLTNERHTVLYTGVTNNLARRVYEHKEKFVKGFTERYNVDVLVYYEVAENAEAAISREKQIKAGSRKKKEELIQAMNPTWKDLYDDIQ
ncbi:MAG: GIY-YIG nuclease family protein [Patescibacteria group bacterium]